MPCGGSPSPLVGCNPSHCLRRAFEEVRILRWVADWLFPSADSPPPPSLPAELFQGALALRMNQSLTQLNFSSTAAKVIMRKQLHMLVVPTETRATATVGYTFCEPRGGEKVAGIDDIAMSRFFYDAAARKFLVVTRHEGANVVSILDVTFLEDGSCQRDFLVVPGLAYSADFLPDTVVQSQCNREARDLSSSPQDFQFPDPDDRIWEQVEMFGTSEEPNADEGTFYDLFSCLDSFADSSQGITATLPGTDEDRSQAVFPSSDIPPVGTECAGSSPIHHCPAGLLECSSRVASATSNIVQSRTPFDMSALSSSLAHLERNLKGNFFALCAKRDVWDPASGDLVTRETGQQISRIDGVPPGAGAQLTASAERCYLLSTTSSPVEGTNMPGLCNSRVLGPAPAEVPVNRSGLPLRVGLNLLADSSPPVADASDAKQASIAWSSARRATPEEAQLLLEKPKHLLTREEKAELRRVRNRRSASRSNQKRRAEVERKEQELVELKERCGELRRRRLEIVAENERLRMLVFGEPVNVVL